MGGVRGYKRRSSTQEGCLGTNVSKPYVEAIAVEDIPFYKFNMYRYFTMSKWGRTREGCLANLSM